MRSEYGVLALISALLSIKTTNLKPLPTIYKVWNMNRHFVLVLYFNVTTYMNVSRIHERTNMSRPRLSRTFIFMTDSLATNMSQHMARAWGRATDLLRSHSSSYWRLDSRSYSCFQTKMYFSFRPRLRTPSLDGAVKRCFPSLEISCIW